MIKDVERLLRKVTPNPRTGCWTWSGGTDRGGYGKFSLKGQGTSAHRASYRILVGPIPGGLEVRHKCDNPPCVNPGHLELGTHADNMRDMAERGRGVGANSLKEVCPRGHPLSGENLKPRALEKGFRDCLACSRGKAAVLNARTRKGVELDFEAESNRHYKLILDRS